MNTKLLGIGLAAGAFWSVGLQDASACEPFTYLSSGETRALSHVDFDPEGPSPGDQHIGYRTIYDEDGNEIGYARWINTFLGGPDESDPGETLLTAFLVLEDGHIHVTRLAGNSRPISDTSGPPSISAEPGIITGGSGAYAGAYGNVTPKWEDDKIKAVVDIACSR